MSPDKEIQKMGNLSTADRRMDGGMHLIILGIDPGLATIGYGVIEEQKHAYKPIDYGIISTPAGISLPRRLQMIFSAMEELIARFSPDEIAFEELFFNKNVKTALNVAHARGVLVLAAMNSGRPMFEYTPLQVKQAVVGYGRADKHQVQHMVMTLLGLSGIPKPDDAADALAIAICHSHSKRFTEQFKI